LFERARLMHASPYIKKSYMWTAFCERNPEIVKQVAAQEAGIAEVFDAPAVETFKRRRSVVFKRSSHDHGNAQRDSAAAKVLGGEGYTGSRGDPSVLSKKHRSAKKARKRAAA